MPLHASYVARPSTLPYSPLGLWDLPFRLLNPPPAPCKTRAFQIAPDYKIELDDILDNRHLPPLALKDFEEYLLFQEYSAENLYFIMWLKDYTDLYNHYTSGSGRATSGELAVRFSRALSTFFDSNSNLALNLPHNLSSSIVGVAKETSHPDPVVFAEVKQQVKDMLRDSLMRFVRICFGNAGKNRGIFSACLGLSFVLIGWIPVIATFATGTSRWIRLAGWIWFCLGWSAFIAATNGLCLIMYSFTREDARQLHPYELAAPRIPESAIPITLKDHGVDDMDEERKIGGGFSDPQIPYSPTTPGPPASLLTASFIRPPSEYSAPSITAPSSTVVDNTYRFDFDALPPTPKKQAGVGGKDDVDSLWSSSSPMFSAVTRVTNPIIKRSHWEVASKSFLLGHIVGTLMAILVVAVPQTHRHH